MNSKNIMHDENLFKILLSPISYFHSDYCEFSQTDIPVHLQPAYNTFMIRKFELDLPSNYKASLPRLLLHKWWKLPEIAMIIGAISLTNRNSWWLKNYFDNSIPISNSSIDSKLIKQFVFSQDNPAQVKAIGLARLLFIINPFGEIYSNRLKYMFSKQTVSHANTLASIPTSWSLFCEACQHEEN